MQIANTVERFENNADVILLTSAVRVNDLIADWDETNSTFLMETQDGVDVLYGPRKHIICRETLMTIYKTTMNKRIPDDDDLKCIPRYAFKLKNNWVLEIMNDTQVMGPKRFLNPISNNRSFCPYGVWTLHKTDLDTNTHLTFGPDLVFDAVKIAQLFTYTKSDQHLRHAMFMNYATEYNKS